MKLELICRIDKERWEEGLENARQLGEFDAWFEVWRVPIEGELPERPSAPPNETWWKAVAMCQARGWIIATIVDPADRPIAWASPQFRAADPNAWLPVAFR